MFAVFGFLVLFSRVLEDPDPHQSDADPQHCPQQGFYVKSYVKGKMTTIM
jgi:hypothetical protein